MDPYLVTVKFTNHYPESKFSNWTTLHFSSVKAARKFLRKNGYSIKQATQTLSSGSKLTLVLDANYELPTKDQVKIADFDEGIFISIGYDTSGDFDEALRVYQERVQANGYTPVIPSGPALKHLMRRFAQEFNS